MPRKDKEKGREYNKKYREENREQIRELNRKYYIGNREKRKKYLLKNREKIKEYSKKYNQKYFRNNKCKLKKQHKKYYEENKNILSKKSKIYREENKIYIRKWMKKYQLENKENLNKKSLAKRKIRRTKNIDFKIKSYLRTRLWFILKKYTKTGKIMSSKRYGIDYKEIIENLKPFPKDINNYHLDHIKPLCSFSFINTNGSTNLEEVKKAFAPENHQWLTAQENLSKGGKEKINSYI